MILLVIFAFLAGVVTVLSPCILPMLPLILSSSLGGENIGRARPLGVVVGFVASFTLFTLFLSALVSFLGVPADVLRLFAVFVIGLFGISFLIPRFQIVLEKLFSRLTGLAPQRTNQKGFHSGFLLGLSLGLLWTPCVGPILASVISLALTGSVTLAAFVITFSYALGTALPMFLIMWGGRELLNRVPWLLRNTANIQKGFGILMILVAIAIYTNLDRAFQTYIINTFPQYGIGLTKLEDRGFIRQALDKLQGAAGEERSSDLPSSVLRPKIIPAPEIVPGGTWINSAPLTLQDLKGKVVIIDFWTYSCINCQRTFPYLKSWHEKYADQGLVIIGVHSPEFEFEKSEKNVRKAAADFGLTYPIVQDNSFATWRAYQNRYWPAKYFIDKDGYVRYSHFGEGAYDESEKVIQELLKEAGAERVERDIDNPTYTNYSRTQETYLGYARIENFASPEKIAPNEVRRYSAPAKLPKDGVAYVGEWRITGEYATPQDDSALELDFEAKEVFLVMRPKTGTGQVKVLLDGEMQHFGEDVHEGRVTIDADRLYKLINLPEPGRHLLRLEFLDDNVEIYAFTFG